MNETPAATTITFPVIAIGASAGGLEALEAFFSNAPCDAGFAYVVVQHLSPDHKSLMVELLSKHTTMPVLRIEDGMPLAVDHVYLIPPKRNLVVSKGLLRLVQQDHGHLPNLPIDHFMASLAEEAGSLAVGIVLSGTGSDGTRGIRAIKEAGGTVLVQEPMTARFDGMPRSAINTGLADFVLPPEQMPGELLRFFRDAQSERVGIKLIQARDGEDFDRILELVRQQCGIDFSLYKRSTVMRRIERRMSVNQCSDAAAYVAFLQENPREIAILHKELLIGVTRFFRDPEAWEIVTARVVPEILARHAGGGQVRCWVAGCSTGEEAYSLAIVIAEAIDRSAWQGEVKIFATDVDREAIEYASSGQYPESIVADVSAPRLERFFTRVGDGFRVVKRIRDMVVFAPHNIIRDPPFYRIDLITCRNLLIYLQPTVQKRILSLFHFALNRDGYLWLGSSESLGDLERAFQSVDPKWKIWNNRSEVRPYLTEHLPARGDGIAGSVVGKTTPEERLAQQIQARLVERFVPPGLVVDEQGQVVHVTGDVRPWIDIAPGSLNNPTLSRLLVPSLALPVSTAITRARKEKKTVEYHAIEFRHRDESVQRVTIRAQLLLSGRQTGELVLVTFHDPGPTVAESVITSEAGEMAAERLRDMEAELQHTRESLQAAIEELETTNEELQSTNEELLAANEELQSTNEELQSVNEELFTVNAEHQAKIAELTELNHDIDTYLSSTQIGAIFLDRQLIIRKFTPAVAAQINVMDRDIGRPLAHISHNLLDIDLVEQAERVLLDEQPRELEVRGANQHAYITRCTPYRSAAGELRGVVITFLDVTALRETIERLRPPASALQSSSIAALILDSSQAVVWSNPRFTALAGYEPSQIAGCHVRILLDRSTSEEALQQMHAEVRQRGFWHGQWKLLARDARTLAMAIWAAAVAQPADGVLLFAWPES
ncbi:MAG: PAS domain-containing protein [Planctomycetota bacterium]|nr:PAS domain-containing protein [Planctomycetota bacterium]